MTSIPAQNVYGIKLTAEETRFGSSPSRYVVPMVKAVVTIFLLEIIYGRIGSEILIAALHYVQLDLVPGFPQVSHHGHARHDHPHLGHYTLQVASYGTGTVPATKHVVVLILVLS